VYWSRREEIELAVPVERIYQQHSIKLQASTCDRDEEKRYSKHHRSIRQKEDQDAEHQLFVSTRRTGSGGLAELSRLQG